MRRHPSLIPLSRLHHKMLVLAQVLKSDVPDYKNMPTDCPGKSAYAIQVYKQVIVPYLSTNTNKLYPGLISANFPENGLLEEVKRMENRMIDCFENLLHAEDTEEYELDKLGCLIESLVRKKERQLFERVQCVLSDEQLDNINIA
jgi:hypothetical protein